MKAIHAQLAETDCPVLSGEGPDLAGLLAQLERYKQQTEHLARLNELHHRLAGATDLTSVAESFSVWLMPRVEHSLLAYEDGGSSRRCLVCSSHGPQRRQEMACAEELLDERTGLAGAPPVPGAGFHSHLWPVAQTGSQRRLLLLRRGRPFREEELTTVQEALPVLGEPLRRAAAYEDLYAQARRDSLTGLANRRVFEENVPAILESARRHGTPVTLASMDLDFFKLVNDTCGHAVGDLVLQQVASILTALVRGSDLLVRMGGDEFLLVLPNTDAEAAHHLAERLGLAVRQLARQTPGCEQLGISIGIAEWQPAMSREEWLQAADDALYRAKAAGRPKRPPELRCV
ncbi:MAG: GGDEF domain-containing protein [Thermodesulfobacteriota bacterium]